MMRPVHLVRPIADSHGHIGMGGFFKVLGGRVRSHVMPDYGCIGFDYYDTERERVVRDFLQFYEHMGPAICCVFPRCGPVIRRAAT